MNIRLKALCESCGSAPCTVVDLPFAAICERCAHRAYLAFLAACEQYCDGIDDEGQMVHCAGCTFED